MEKIQPSHVPKSKFINVLLFPNTLLFLDFDQLINLGVLNKEINLNLNGKLTQTEYWAAISYSIATRNGLYLPSLYMGSRRFFFNEMWASRKKWNLCNFVGKEQSFKIVVSSRFRPGRRDNIGFELPLHQFLRVKRRQVKKSAVLIGENDPEKYLDPYLHTLMREPVLLRTSGIIMDRSVALHFVLRGGHDPITNTKLTSDMLVPLPELATEIEEWKIKKKESDNVLVTAMEVKSILDEDTVDPALLDALIEAERLRYEAMRADGDAFDEVDAQPFLTADQIPPQMAPLESTEILPLPPTYSKEINQRTCQQSDALDNIENIPIPINSSDSNLEAGNIDTDGCSRWRKSKTIKENPHILDINNSKSCVSLSCPGVGIRQFHFTKVYDAEASQKDVYNNSARDLVTAVVNGFNGCLLCYGQTGSGKTHTMFGPENTLETHQVRLGYQQSDSRLSEDYVKDIPDNAGLVVRACAELLYARQQLARNGINISLSAHFVEIYNEQIVDLFSGRLADARRETGELVSVDELQLDNLTQAIELLRRGHARKRFASTAMNDRSSRSHTIFIISLTQSRLGSNVLVKSQLHLVDLAGSERVKKSKAEGGHLQEAVGINSSLLVLGRVISSLVEARRHVPYLDSKLTTVLRKAFGGNSRTAVIVSCQSDDTHGEETLQSLRFGERCAMISNSTKQVASSVTSALESIDEALHRVEHQMKVLESKGKQNLASYQTVRASYSQLILKRKDLIQSVELTSSAI